MRILKFWWGKLWKNLGWTNPTWRHLNIQKATCTTDHHWVNWGSTLAIEEFHIYINIMRRRMPIDWLPVIFLIGLPVSNGFHQGSQCRLQLSFLQEMANFRWFYSVNYGNGKQWNHPHSVQQNQQPQWSTNIYTSHIPPTFHLIKPVKDLSKAGCY